jgi:hypothetical protein
MKESLICRCIAIGVCVTNLSYQHCIINQVNVHCLVVSTYCYLLYSTDGINVMIYIQTVITTG